MPHRGVNQGRICCALAQIGVRSIFHEPRCDVLASGRNIFPHSTSFNSSASRSGSLCALCGFIFVLVHHAQARVGHQPAMARCFARAAAGSGVDAHNMACISISKYNGAEKKSRSGIKMVARASKGASEKRQRRCA